MQVNEGGQCELSDIKNSLHFFDFKYRSWLSVILKDFLNLGIHLKKSTVSWNFKAGIPVAFEFNDVWNGNGANTNENFKEELEWNIRN